MVKLIQMNPKYVHTNEPGKDVILLVGDSNNHTILYIDNA